MKTNKPGAILVDDEDNLLSALRQELTDAWPELDILGTAANGREALQKIDKLKPDVVFLDIKMPGISGLQVAEKIPPETLIVFVTAFDEFAIRAFEKSAVDYLLKPVNGARLKKTVERLKNRLAKSETQDLTTLRDLLAQMQPPSEDFLEWIRAGQGDSVQLIPVDAIDYFQAAHKYTSVFTADGEFVIRTTIKELVEALDPKAFWQIHRGTIVAAKQVAHADKDFRGRFTVQLKNRKEHLKVSQSYANHFRQM